MEGTWTWIVAIIALIMGAAGGYAYMQDQTSRLSGQIAALETQVADANWKAMDAATHVVALEAELERKTKLVEQQQARIMELEAMAQTASPAAAQ